MKNVIYFLFVFMLLFKTVSAQTRYSMPVKPIATKLINKEILYNDVLSQPNYDIHIVTVFTNYCPGTPQFFQRLKTLDSMGYKNIHWVCCSSADLKDSLETIQTMKKYGVYVDTVYLINSNKYKEDKTDDRYKGFLFRKDVCKPCRRDIIGVPYTIIYDNKKRVIDKGYKRTPAIIIDLLSKLKKE